MDDYFADSGMRFFCLRQIRHQQIVVNVKIILFAENLVVCYIVSDNHS